jgi:hypothetical protein
MRARREFTNRVASSAGREEAGYGFASNPLYELSPYSTKEEDDKLIKLASMMHLLTEELLRQKVQ